MIDKIQKFFKNKKTESAFKRAGPGYRLNESPLESSHSTKGASSSGSSSCDNNSYSYQLVQGRTGLSQECKQGAAAALARLDAKKNGGNFNKSVAAIKARVRKELEAEQAAAQPRTIKETELESASVLATKGIYFQCPLIGPDILTKKEWNQKIRDFLYEQLKEEKGLVACLMVHTLNWNKDKIDACIQTITRYFENILKYPTDEKYRKIRMSNKVFAEKVKPIEGALLIFEAAGFEMQELTHEDSCENFLVFPKEKISEAPEIFEILLDGLKNAEPITLQLHRDLQVLLPTQAKERNALPTSFFNLTVDEIKREQFLRSELVERNQTLRTKAMREKDEIHEIRTYKYTLIRIRFPDGIVLQGTFGVHEKATSIIEFVKEALDDESLKFKLMTPEGHQLDSNSETTLIELKLVPAVILIFSTEMSRETYLKPEVLMLVESLSITQ